MLKMEPTMKVVHIAVGECHNLLLTEDGRIYAWGKGMFGRLGTGEDRDELLPVNIPIKTQRRGDQSSYASFVSDDVKIVGIAAGAYHNLALSDDGLIWSWGYNVYGQLGRKDEMTSVPCLVEEIVDKGSTELISENIERDKAKREVKNVDTRQGQVNLGVHNSRHWNSEINAPEDNNEGWNRDQSTHEEYTGEWNPAQSTPEVENNGWGWCLPLIPAQWILGPHRI